MRNALAGYLVLLAVAAFFAGMALRASGHHCAGYAFSLAWAGIGGVVVLGMTGGGGKPPNPGGVSASRVGPNPTG